MVAKMLACICMWVAVTSFVDAEGYFSVHGRQAFPFPNSTGPPHSELRGTLAEESDREWRVDMSRECKKQQRRYVFRPESRIVQGDIVNYPENYPWMVSLHKGSKVSLASDAERFSFQCGAVIVARRWILTAAHCLLNHADGIWTGPGPDRCVGTAGQEKKCFLEERYVKFGYVTQQGEEPTALTAQYLYPYGKYGERSRSDAHDIALVYLKEKIPRDKYVPICLSLGRKMDYSRKNQPFLIGWGNTERGGVRSPILKKTSLDVYPAAVCGTGDFPLKTIICAKAQNASACQGDSGGPLSKVRNGITYILGVQSKTGCRVNDQNTFARVSKYRRWIRRHIERRD